MLLKCLSKSCRNGLKQLVVISVLSTSAWKQKMQVTMKNTFLHFNLRVVTLNNTSHPLHKKTIKILM